MKHLFNGIVTQYDGILNNLLTILVVLTSKICYNFYARRTRLFCWMLAVSNLPIRMVNLCPLSYFVLLLLNEDILIIRN